MDLDYKTIGKRIKIARINADMTQDALAALIDKSNTHTSDIETGTTKVSLTTIVNIANALSVMVDDLLCDNLIHTKPQFERDIQQIIDSCDEYEIRVVKEMAQAVLKIVRSNDRLKKSL